MKKCQVCDKTSGEFDLCEECTQELNNTGTILGKKNKLLTENIDNDAILYEYYHMASEVR